MDELLAQLGYQWIETQTEIKLIQPVIYYKTDSSQQTLGGYYTISSAYNIYSNSAYNIYSNMDKVIWRYETLFGEQLRNWQTTQFQQQYKTISSIYQNSYIGQGLYGGQNQVISGIGLSNQSAVSAPQITTGASSVPNSASSVTTGSTTSSGLISNILGSFWKP